MSAGVDVQIPKATPAPGVVTWWRRSMSRLPRWWIGSVWAGWAEV
ncbi:hypothetical protein SIM91_31425 [Rhodococcus opacus]|nr:hypothetical protein [Rhodococcus opacus]MDX5967733.1 hypothetical protein [Rhodococcus opacus]